MKTIQIIYSHTTQPNNRQVEFSIKLIREWVPIHNGKAKSNSFTILIVSRVKY